MSNLRVVVDPGAFQELATSPEVVRNLRARAMLVAARARRQAPYDPTSDGIHIRDNIGIEDASDATRARVRVVAATAYAARITKDNPTWFTSAMDAAGGG